MPLLTVIQNKYTKIPHFLHCIFLQDFSPDFPLEKAAKICYYIGIRYRLNEINDQGERI